MPLVDGSNPTQLGLGTGLYSLTQAALLARANSRAVRRWMFGYTYKVSEGHRSQRPVVSSEAADAQASGIITFHDLIELMFVSAFRKAGVSWRTIRAAAATAREITDSPHPFSTRRFVTDGEAIFAEVATRVGETDLLNLISRQFAFKRMLLPSLREQLDINEDLAQRWWPMGREKPVILDPNRQFGQPISYQEGIPTAALAAAFQAQKSYVRVSAWYDVPVPTVRAAVAFERQYAAAA